jgi:transposase
VDAKKKTLGATERDPVARATWTTVVAPTLDPRRIIAVDEMATTISLTRLSGYAPSAERCVGRVPKNHGLPTSLVAALSLQGLEAAMTRPGSIDTLAFAAFVEKILRPLLKPGDLVLLDNLSAHKALSVRAQIEATGAVALFLPSYSPDFNPIELAFSKVKQVLRSAAARTQEALEAAIAHALDAVTPEDARAYFRHCGITFQPDS